MTPEPPEPKTSLQWSGGVLMRGACHRCEGEEVLARQRGRWVCVQCSVDMDRERRLRRQQRQPSKLSRLVGRVLDRLEGL